MYIQANLPDRYGPFRTIQGDNFPFNVKFLKFIKNFAQLQSSLGYDIQDTIGYIESKLIFIGTDPRKDPTKSPVNFRYDTTDTDIVRMYKNSDLSNKQITILMVQLVIDLSEIYNTSMTHMAYQLKDLQQQLSQPVTYPNLQPAVQVPLQAPLVTPVVSPVESSVTHDESDNDDDVTSEPVVPKIKTKQALPAIDTHKPKAKSKRPKAVEPKTESNPLDDLSARAKRLAAKVEETKAAPGTQVTTNPLLGDFL